MKLMLKVKRKLSRKKKQISYDIDRESIATNGNRFDVNLVQRIRTPIYWDAIPNDIRRSKWFYLPEQEGRFIPYDEQMNEILEVKEKKIH